MRESGFVGHSGCGAGGVRVLAEARSGHLPVPVKDVSPDNRLVTNDDFAILAAIAAAESHPYRLLDHLGALGIQIPRSTLYRRVDALVAEGLLTARGTRGKNGHERRALTLTERGRERLAGLAGAIVRREPLASPRFALAIACARALDTTGLPEVLRSRMAAAARRLTAEERRLAALGDDVSFWERASQERQVAHLKADLQWLQELRARATRGPDGSAERTHRPARPREEREDRTLAAG
ncbi:MAG: hypothetical protein Kow0010_25620 [Dehalococcoidia bacterium]